jgi:hypothetical protein
MFILRSRTILRLAVIVLASVRLCAAAGRDSHIRSTDPGVLDLLDSGRARSATLRQLAAAIERSDLIVYLRFDLTLPQGMAGRVTFMAAAGGRRYLHVGISRALCQEDQTAILGHELQHAVEIAQAAEVVSPSALRRLYRSIGFPIGYGSNRYDTAAAIDAGFLVRRELQRRASFVSRTARPRLRLHDSRRAVPRREGLVDVHVTRDDRRVRRAKLTTRET